MTQVKGKRRLLLQKLLLALAASLVTLIILEILARAYVTHFADRERFSRYASVTQYRERVRGDEWWFGLVTPHRYLGYIPVPNLVDDKNRHNSLGFRGEEITVPKPKGEFRIVCIGASTTYSLLVPESSLSYPALLQRELRQRGYDRVTVVNAGVIAWTSYENLLGYLLRVQDLEPDMIIVKEAFGDVLCRMVWPPSAFKGDNSGCLAPHLTVRQPPLYEASALARILLVESGLSLPTSAMGKSVYAQAETNYFFEFFNQRLRGTYPSGIFRTVPIARMFQGNHPAYYRRNVEDLLLMARARDVQPVLMTFPYNETYPGLFGIEGFQAATDQHNSVLREISAELGIPLLDLDAQFPKDVAYWGADGIHVNRKGTALEAKSVADFLLSEGLIPPADKPLPASDSSS